MVDLSGRERSSRDDERRGRIGGRLRGARMKGGYTLERVAQACGVSRNAVASWERGVSFPIPENLVTVAALYGVSLDWLLAEEAEAIANDEAALLHAYRALPPQKKRLLREIASEYFAG